MSEDVGQESIPEALVRWFRGHHRELPWRREPTPYRVWVSEIMLQQTQVVTVLPYFARWMERFPTVEALAEAPLDDVLALWSGLGYYRRARTLHAAAQQVASTHGGELPGTLEGLLAIPGIGRYTAGAIASIAFGLRAPIVDGNVIRVYARLFGVEGDPTAAATQRRFWALAEELVPAEDPSAYNQAVMELGALVCTPRKPACLLCPVQGRCVAHATGRELELPSPKKAARRRPMHVAAAVVPHPDGGRLLLAQRPAEGLFGGLWELPGVEVSAEAEEVVAASQEALQRLLGAAGEVVGPPLGALEHTLSHIDLVVRPFAVRHVAPEAAAACWERTAWATLEEARGWGLSSIARRALDVAAGVL